LNFLLDNSVQNWKKKNPQAKLPRNLTGPDPENYT